MKTEKNILVAFLLNLAFSVFEFFGGIYTGSVAILADAIHDIGDALSIGLSFFLEKKSKKQPDNDYTYGYARYSVLGSLITNFILLTGSFVVISNAISRIITPTQIKYNEMIMFALIGVTVNFCAAFFTRGEGSLNQKAVNLHMLEDVFGWGIVLLGAIVMRFTDFVLLDPILSVATSLFIFSNAIKNLKEIFDIFLEKSPENIDIDEIKEHILSIDGVIDIHHIHIWSIDGQNNYATMHVVTNTDIKKIKEIIRKELLGHKINHVTLEFETERENCTQKVCNVNSCSSAGHYHHHSHHH